MGTVNQAFDEPFDSAKSEAMQLQELPTTDPDSVKKSSTASRYISAGIQVTLIVLLIVHLGFSTKYFIDNSDESVGETTCTGYGFLIILDAFILYGFAYKYVIRPYCLPVVNQLIIKPIKVSVTDKLFARYPILNRIIVPIFYLAVTAGFLVFLIVDSSDNRRRLIPLAGLAIFLIFGYAISKHRTKINWQTVIWGVFLQVGFGLLTIRWEIGRNIFRCAGDKVSTFLSYARRGAAFVYGNELVFEFSNGGGIFAFSAISTIYFLGFFINILYHYGIMQYTVTSLGSFLKSIMGTSICESVNSAANIFLGQSEAPLLLKPYLKNLTASEIHSILTSGFATVSGSVFAAYISFGASPANLITSSVMSAPAALCYSKLMYPETEEPVEAKDLKMVTSEYTSALDAASQGATQATQLVMGIIANLISFLAFVYLINGVLQFFGESIGFIDANEIWSLDRIVGYVFIPVSFIMGVPWDECENVGKLIGIKTMVNEFAAFAEFTTMDLTPRTKVIATYAICGFANPSSIGIMISAMSILIPNKTKVITSVAFRAFIGGCVVCFMTACIAAMLIPEDMVDM